MMKINLILLASGDSTRFRSNKLLTIVNNKPMYMNVIDEVLKINFHKIVLVTQYEDIKLALLNKNIEVVMNKNSELGISHSIELAMKKDVEADAYMFMVCDQPFIKSQTIENLIFRFMESKKGMACVEFNGNLGNPTIFSKKYIHELLNLKGDVGGKAVMKKHPDDLEKVSIVDEMEIKDIDTREELINISYNNIYEVKE
ncbi:nucleotidyltransferase family protein [Clostridium botulinum]|uniref:Nucleotidyltransferase family protein n=1 Tax=Clostridium botulinum TaxID=1491 RepID=A0A6B4JMY7_CLOBO|nr:nucleotidyltransferase family protein [Clostridium botulinum]EES49094.1 molybdopterin-guanine dinucleotide biosynthesis protein A [Clostridium botulinum E1 str. 'BoNT E Beluga']MBY6762171.1 nucleotidyltransferase family protein [Clostridium botulinum]MBY6920516.1 nucleotidyltransferase family protein [Clostridium botulinum]MCR1131768.1 nucleotidyltransferase family protein [Clostridium botulinum]NFH68893.1 nucleotidyltransferase family protein [Clostridium botulinum]